jgi:hypothetical protein
VVLSIQIIGQFVRQSCILLTEASLLLLYILSTVGYLALFVELLEHLLYKVPTNIKGSVVPHYKFEVNQNDFILSFLRIILQQHIHKLDIMDILSYHSLH